MIRLALVASLLLISSAAVASERVYATAPRTTGERPISLFLEAGIGTPTGLLGGGVQYQFTPEWAGFFGGGIGVSGVQVAVLARYSVRLERTGRNSFVFGLGPSMGFRVEDWGFWIERTDNVEVVHDKLYFTAWMNAEIAWEVRARMGLTARVVVGAGFRMADNQAALCDERFIREEGDCASTFMVTAASTAELPIIPYLGGSFGYSF